MNKKTIVLAVLLIFSLGFLFFSLHPAGKKPIPVKNETGMISEEDFWKETADLLEKSRLAGLPAYYHPTEKDPMRQPMQPAAFAYAGANSLAQPFKVMVKGTPYSLTGVLVGKGRTGAAIINEKIYRVGDTVGDKKIVAIEKNRVVLKKGTEEEILRLANN